MAAFDKVATWTGRKSGSAATFGLALGTIMVWGITGPLFGFSDTWQLVINTGTTIVTFLMVFLIQNTQNRSADALQLKLDELLRAVNRASERMIGIEDLPQAELDRLKGLVLEGTGRCA